MRFKWMLLALVISLAPAGLWAGPHEDGEAAYEAGDYATAYRHFRPLAEQGSPRAQLILGVMYQYGLGVPQDHAEAVKWYRKPAEQGVAAGQFLLAVMYHNGQGVPQDYTETVRWLRLAAGQGYASAQAALGQMYDNGQGVPQDDAEAVRWFRLAAEQGRADAQNNLGVMYGNGQGVPQDYAEAVRWYRKSAEQGDQFAQSNLGKMYRDGKGISQDFLLAHLLFNLAAAQGFQGAAEDRDALAVQMTPPQIAEAQRLAREWQAISAAPAEKAAERKTISGLLQRLRPKSSGSGFVVSAAGDVLTNQHVVDSCDRLTARADTGSRALSLVRSDARNDLALLHMEGPPPVAARFRQGRGVRAGESVVVMGFPLPGLLSSQVNVTTGTVSSLSGPGDDSRLMQITAPVQPGNSGGPILDEAGNVVGIVVSKLNALKVAAVSGDIPQNVNFGIHAAVARTFLDAAGVEYQTAAAKDALDPATIADAARAYTVRIECW